jgi:hypothetical protein
LFGTDGFAKQARSISGRWNATASPPTATARSARTLTVQLATREATPAMDGHNASERTPLLSGERETANNHIQDGNGRSDQPPNITNIEHTLRLTGDGHGEPFDAASTLGAVQSLAVSATEKAALLLLISLRHIERLGERKVGVSAAAKLAQSKDREAAERLRDETYDQMCEEGDEFVEQVLWTSFPKDVDGKEEQSGVYCPSWMR